MNYLAAFALGGTLALLVATGIISFFRFVTEPRRRKIARAFRTRARSALLRQSGVRRFEVPTMISREPGPRGAQFHDETAISD